METRFLVDRGEVAGLTIDDLDVDRYTLDDDTSPEEVLIAARELQLSGVTNRSWQGLHLINTRGCGLVLAPAGRVLESQRPDYRTVPLERPELYFSPTLSGYAIANSASSERECDEPHQYAGKNGVQMNSFVRRAAFALAFLDYNVLGSGAITKDSEMLWVRGVSDRLEKLAPFLSYDTDPYPVAVNGRAMWVVDAFTTSTRYPYGERIGDVQRKQPSGLGDNDNYVRNSVKAVVDAYSGEVTFYVVDDQDPILAAWRSAFPNLFTPVDQMPEELRAHLRYPEDLFRIQTDMYSKYRIDASLFFQRDGNAWSVAQAPSPTPTSSNGEVVTPASADGTVTAAQQTFATESDALRFTPYYTVFNTSLPEDPRKNEFVLLRPFVPFSTNDERTELQAYMTASSDPEDYGKLTSYFVQEKDGRLPDGPLARGQQRRVDRGDLAPDLARQRRRRRIAGALRRPPDRSGRGWADLRPSVLRVGAPEFGLGQHGHRVPVGDRVVQRSRRPRTHPRAGTGARCSRASKVRSAIGSTPRPNRRTVRTREPRRPPMTRRTPPPRPPGARTRTARPTPCSCSTRPMHSSTRRTRPWPTAISAHTRPRSTRPGRTSPKRCRSSRTDRFTSRGRRSRSASSARSWRNWIW